MDKTVIERAREALVAECTRPGSTYLWHSGSFDDSAAMKAVAKLLTVQDELENALKFYARDYSWRSSTVYMCGHSGQANAVLDRGNKARQALSTLRNAEPAS